MTDGFILRSLLISGTKMHMVLTNSLFVTFTRIYFAVVHNEAAACVASFGRQSLLFKVQEFLQGIIVPKYGLLTYAMMRKATAILDSYFFTVYTLLLLKKK